MSDLRTKRAFGLWMTFAVASVGSGAGCAMGEPPPGDARADVRDVSLVDAAPDVVDTGVLPDRPDVPIPAMCGDGICTRTSETCLSCPIDCGQCPRCDMAPTCTGALAVPTSTSLIADCNNVTSAGSERANYSCGTSLGVPPSQTTCSDPKLRIRLREISIQRGVFDIPSNLYCAITAEDGMHSELVLTPARQVAGNRNTTTINFRPSEALVWGQGDLYRSVSNITLTYSCFLTSDGATAQRVLDDISMRAVMAAAHADGYGWVFGAVAVLGTVIGSSLSTQRDSQILDVQQTIAAGALLTMTNGKTWEIRIRRGNLDLSGASDLKLTMESWGCADVRPPPPP